jgi:hypothetical protein
LSRKSSVTKIKVLKNSKDVDELLAYGTDVVMIVSTCDRFNIRNNIPASNGSFTSDRKA